MSDARRLAREVGKYASLFILIVLLIIVLFPLFMIALNAFKTPAEYSNAGPLSLPSGLNLTVITDTWERLNFTQKLLNSAFISLSVALLGIVLSVLNAFALGIGRVKGRVVLLVVFLVANTLPHEALAYPLYYAAKLVNLYNTQLAVILVFTVIQSAFGTYLLSSVFASFPREMLEAALIDGATKLDLIVHIVVPNSIPTLSVLFVFLFTWTWNEFFLPMVLLPSTSKQTVPLAVAVLQGQHMMDVTASAASALLGVLPCILFFVFFQRTLTKGVTAGSVK